MYRKNPRSCTGNKYKILHFYWANFGWGTTTTGHPVHHPHEVWLYTCSGPSLDEWYKEEPVKVAFARNVKVDAQLRQKLHASLTGFDRREEYSNQSRIMISLNTMRLSLWR
jgi:hypothetical protein